MPVVGLAGGILSYGLPPAELRPDVNAGLASIVNLQARLDGQSLRKRLVKSFVHPLKLQPGNLLQELDPTVIGTSTPVATGTWLVWIRNLNVGNHRVFLAATFDDGVTLDLTVHLRVQ